MIQVFTCLTHNSEGYSEFLKKNLSENAKNKDNIIFNAIIDDKFNGNTSWTIVDTVKTPHKLFVGYGAKNHSTMLNKIINHIDDKSDIIVICDCDVAILKKNWDLKLLELHKKYDALITPKFSGKSSVYFTSFTKKVFKEIKFDFRPGNKENDYKVTTIYEDTGYKIQDQLINKKMFFYTLEGFDGEIYKRKVDNKNLHYLYKIGESNFITHFGGSHKTDFKSKSVKDWISQINTELKNE